MARHSRARFPIWLLALVILTGIGWLESAKRPEAPKTTETRTVVRVIDGDTLILNGDERVRLIGIDAPEVGEPGFVEAGQALAELAPVGSDITITYDRDRYDQYGRTLGYLSTDELFINQTLVEYGWAVPMAIPPNLTYEKDLSDAYRVAQKEKRGLFGDI